MKWEMEVDEVEVVLEKIWDLHDSISDAIHAISRAHFLRSIRGATGGGGGGGNKGGDEKRCHPGAGAGGGAGDDGVKSGYVFVKGFKLEGEEDEAAVAEARSLNSIRTALEDFEEQLEFFHTVQSQQRAERDAAIARLEQSRIILAMRLADHHGKRFKVIEEAMAFVGDVCDTRFVAPEDLFHSQSCGNSNVLREKRSNFLIDMLISSFALAKKFLQLDRFGGALGNATLFAVSMLALLQLHQVTGKGDFVLEAPPARERTSFYRERNAVSNSHLENTSNGNQTKRLDVLAARG